MEKENNNQETDAPASEWSDLLDSEGNMDNFFDKKEASWLKKLEKILASKPESIKLYSTEGDISACKVGVPADDLCRNIAYDVINATNMISDIHE